MRYLTVEDYAERMSVSRKTIRERCARGFYPKAFKEGRRWYIPVEEERTAPSKYEIADEVLKAIAKAIS